MNEEFSLHDYQKNFITTLKTVEENTFISVYLKRYTENKKIKTNIPLRIINLPENFGKKICMVYHLINENGRNRFMNNIIITNFPKLWEKYFNMISKTKMYYCIQKKADITDECLKYTNLIVSSQTCLTYLINKYVLHKWNRIIYDLNKNFKFDFLIANFTWIITNCTSYPEKSIFSIIKKKYPFLDELWIFDMLTVKFQYNSSQIEKKIDTIFYNYSMNKFIKEMGNYLPSPICTTLDSGNFLTVYCLLYMYIKEIKHSVNNNLINLLMSLDSFSLEKMIKIKCIEYIINTYFSNCCFLCFEIPKNPIMLNCCHNICCEKCIDIFNTNCFLCNSEYKPDMNKLEFNDRKNKGNCSVCYEDSCENSIPILSSCCKQVFCSNCILNWLGLNNKDTCPYCRENMNFGNIVFTNYKFDPDISPNTIVPYENKDTKIYELIHNNPRKYLVISLFVPCFINLNKLLEKENKEVIILHTCKSKRKKQLKNLGTDYILGLSHSFDKEIEDEFSDITDVILWHDFDNKFINLLAKYSKKKLIVHNFSISN